MKKYLFLDVDGVLNTQTSWHLAGDSFFESCLANLRLIKESTGCDIVLSSAWRRFKDKEPEDRDYALLVRALTDIDCMFIDTTPVIEKLSSPSIFNREKEIEQWLEQKAEKPYNYAIVDDMDIFPNHSKNFVLTEVHEGLTIHKASIIISILNSDL